MFLKIYVRRIKNGECLLKGYTFDDLLLLPAKSQVLPKDVSLTTKLTNKLN